MSDTVSVSRDGNIAVITINNPPVNALSKSVRAGLLEAVQQVQSDSAVEGIVIHCEGRTFIAGADIREFDQQQEGPSLPEVTAAIEDGDKPCVAALFGTALGGGFEVALACHHRVAVPAARVGLPEVKLGVIPGSGGTQRLPRLVGVKPALDAILDGRKIDAKTALQMGAIDAVVQDDLLKEAIAFARNVAAEGKPVRRTRELPISPVDDAVFADAETFVARRMREQNAPVGCITAVKAAVEKPFEEGMQIERKIFKELKPSEQAAALRHVFFAERAAAKLPGIAKDTPSRKVDSVAIIGAGTMGGGIAMAFANVGIQVYLVDNSQEGLDRGLSIIRKNYQRTASKGRISAEEMDARLGRIKGTLAWADLKDADLFIEAVFEELDLKKDIFKKIDAVAKPGAVLATNTSYIEIDKIADSTSRPQDVVGMHFFSPANVMRLLENVRGKQTAPDVCVTAMSVGRTIQKLPVLVNVCDGFVGNRMHSKRSREGYFMLEEGALPEQVDKAMVAFGFPMGPFAASDLAGLDVGWRNRRSRFDRLTEREQKCNILDQLCEQGRHGQKTQAGFYLYDDQRKRQVDAEVEKLIVQHSKARGLQRRQISDEEIVERIVFALINEGARILEEGVAARASDIDLVWLNGYGFPAYRGGPMFYADQIGLKKVYERILHYRDKVGSDYWEPAPLIARLAEQGKGIPLGMTVTVDQATSLPPTNEAVIPDEYLDFNGHMNVRWYAHLFNGATMNIQRTFGVTPEYKKQSGCGSFMLESHIRYLAEVRVGQTVSVHSRVLGHSASKIHLMHIMVNRSRQRVACVSELLLGWVDLKARKLTPLPNAVLEPLAAVAARDQALDWRAPVCGIMRP